MRFSRKAIVGSILVIALVLGAGAFFVFRENIFSSAEKTFHEEETKVEETKSSPEDVSPPEQREEAEEESDKALTESDGNKAEETPTLPLVSSLPLFNIFGKASVAPDAYLDGAGTSIDSPEFFETPNYREVLLLVSGKGNDVVEVWKYPFKGNEQSRLKRSSLPNGLAIDQERDWLLIGDSGKQEVAVYTLPGLKHVKDIGRGKLGNGETNADVLTRPGNNDVIYATEGHRVHGFEAESGKEVADFAPKVESIEEVLVDDYHGIVYVPEENGEKSKLYPGGAVTAYTPDGKPFVRKGTNVLARGVFTGDGEGATLYTCLNEKKQDTGRGFLIFADQGGSRGNGLEFFNRETWKHLGTLTLPGVSMTDGIASIQQSFPEYPQGILAASNDDKNTALVSWEKIASATGLRCE